MTPTNAADAVLDDILAAVAGAEPAVIVDSPPGAGKTFLVELAVHTAASCGDKVMVAAQTNAQLLDLTARLCRAYPDVDFGLLVRSGLEPPSELVNHSRLHVATSRKGLPDIVLATTAKWATVGARNTFDLAIIDEAYQLLDASFAGIATQATRFLFVGDPGQIAPVVATDVRRWLTDPAGPQVPAPTALRHRRPDDVRVFQLPTSRRLGQDTVDVVQPTFYPSLMFESSRPPRQLTGTDVPGWLHDAERRGHELVMRELPTAPFAPTADPGVAAAIADTVRAVLGCVVETEHGTRPMRPDDVIVACPHVRQVVAVRAELGEELAAVRCDTVERVQGTEAEVCVTWHALSGQIDPSEFAKDAGRLCVSVSRHKCLAVVVGRAGAIDVLDRVGAGDRRSFVADDPAYRGWQAHRDLLDRLHADGRVSAYESG
ncbi:MAG TPA: AAA family ATPase [Acidimicrobiales bacterium]|nr:AAA family ATPase [Acidimicrobiales bacterium]